MGEKHQSGKCQSTYSGGEGARVWISSCGRPGIIIFYQINCFIKRALAITGMINFGAAVCFDRKRTSEAAKWGGSMMIRYRPESRANLFLVLSLQRAELRYPGIYYSRAGDVSKLLDYSKAE